MVRVEVESRSLTEVFAAFGQRGVPAKTVAQGLAGEVRSYLEEAGEGPKFAHRLLERAGEGSRARA